MIFDLLTLPQGRGQNCAVARSIHVSNSHQIWLDLSNVVEGDGIKDGRTDGQMDGRSLLLL